MTSKESLEGIEQYILNNKGRLCFFIKLYLGAIKQDLERLEMLEHYQASAITLTKENMTLYQQNEKLKKAIEIIKDKVLITVNIPYAWIETKDNCVYFKVNQQEYELLKEVINNE